MNQILECVPNFSEGRDLSVIEKLCDSFRGKPACGFWITPGTMTTIAVSSR